MTDLEMIEQIEIMDWENSILDQLANLKMVLDIYEDKHHSFVPQSEYIEVIHKDNMTESEIFKCSNYISKNGNKEKLIERLNELYMQPKRIYILKIHYVNAKKRYDNLKAFYQLKFKIL
jgi:hypothetical protein